MVETGLEVLNRIQDSLLRGDGISVDGVDRTTRRGGDNPNSLSSKEPRYFLTKNIDEDSSSFLVLPAPLRNQTEHLDAGNGPRS